MNKEISGDRNYFRIRILFFFYIQLAKNGNESMSNSMINKIAQEIKNLAKNRKMIPGDQFPIQRVLCKKLNISRSTLMRTCRRLEEEGYLDCRPGKGIFLANSIVRRKLRHVAVLIFPTQKFESNNYDNYGLEMYWGIEDELKKLHIRSHLMSPVKADSQLFDDLQAYKIDGIILGFHYDDEFIRKLSATKLPVILCGKESFYCSGSVSPDYFSGLRCLVHDLYHRGKHKITIFCNGYDGTYTLALAAKMSMEQEMSNLELNIVNIFRDLLALSNNEYTIYREVEKIYMNGMVPDVFIGGSDWIAKRIIEQLRRLKVSVPDMVEVVGFLGLQLGMEQDLAISTMAVDAQEIGRQSARLIHQINTIRTRCPIFVKTPLVANERKTCRF